MMFERMKEEDYSQIIQMKENIVSQKNSQNNEMIEC